MGGGEKDAHALCLVHEVSALHGLVVCHSGIPLEGRADEGAIQVQHQRLAVVVAALGREEWGSRVRKLIQEGLQTDQDAEKQAPHTSNIAQKQG